MKRDFQMLKFLRLAAALLFVLGVASHGWGAAKCKVLHSFGSGTDGAMPWGPLVLRGGNLYGVTLGGGTAHGSYGSGTVYELSPGNNGRWKEKVLYNSAFASPSGGLVVDPSGDIHGTGSVAYDTGGVFELSPSSGGYSFSILYAGGDAGPGLLMDRRGNLYGEMGPGQDQEGAIGELSPGSDGWNYTQLYSFCRGYFCPDGCGPPAPPIWDGKGNMFGTTTAGGIFSSCWIDGGCGVAFEMTPNGDGTWTYHVLHRFASSKSDGQSPYGGLVMDKAGNFYGATWVGGAYKQGTVYKLSNINGKWKETILYDFPNCALGCMVEGTLAMDKSGNLYGTAAGGTDSCYGEACGVVFELSPQKNGRWKYSVVYDLTPETGGFQPFYGVIVDDKGNLFGVTSSGGKYGGGTAFEITP